MITLYAFAKRPAPGLPFINSGAILGFLIAFAFFR
jgi:presenilin-like A22 family membrane protease